MRKGNQCSNNGIRIRKDFTHSQATIADSKAYEAKAVEWPLKVRSAVAMPGKAMPACACMHRRMEWERLCVCVGEGVCMRKCAFTCMRNGVHV